MNRLLKSHREVAVVLFVLALAAVIAIGVVQNARATSSPWHASNYMLFFGYYAPCTNTQLSQMSAYFPTLSGRTVAINENATCVSGPDNQKGATIEVRIKSSGTVVLTGTVTMDDYAGNTHALGTYNGVTYTTSCEDATSVCGGQTKHTWFVRVEATCN